MQGSIARHPFPGYFGNSAGTTAYFLAYGSGMSSIPFSHFPYLFFPEICGCSTHTFPFISVDLEVTDAAPVGATTGCGIGFCAFIWHGTDNCSLLQASAR